MTIEELSKMAYPEDIVGSQVEIKVGEKPTLSDYNKEKREAYILGANAVLKEIEDELDELPITRTLRGIYNKLNELKGKK